MNKNKSLIISIFVVLLLIVSVAVPTYAYLYATTSEGEVSSGSGNLDINYQKPGLLTGNLKLSTDRNGGLTTNAKVSLKEGSIDALFNMYLTPSALTNVNIAALKWEVVGTSGGSIIYTNNGNFGGASVGVPIKIVNGFALTTSEVTFDIYIWLDASLVTTSISGASFGAKITADSVPITGEY